MDPEVGVIGLAGFALGLLVGGMISPGLRPRYRWLLLDAAEQRVTQLFNPPEDTGCGPEAKDAYGVAEDEVLRGDIDGLTAAQVERRIADVCYRLGYLNAVSDAIDRVRGVWP